jgi:hypothetical protein
MSQIIARSLLNLAHRASVTESAIANFCCRKMRNVHNVIHVLTSSESASSAAGGDFKWGSAGQVWILRGGKGGLWPPFICQHGIYRQLKKYLTPKVIERLVGS